MRDDVEKIVGELASGGGLDVPALMNVRKQGEILNVSPGATGAAEQTTVGGKTYNVDRSSGQVRLIPVAVGVTVQKYNQPEKLGGDSTLKVEKKKDVATDSRFKRPY